MHRQNAIDLLLRQGSLEAAADLVDSVVLAGLNSDARAVLRAGWQDLRTRRKRRATAAEVRE